MKIYLEKIGSVGAVIAAAACPVCFPKLALLGALFGLGAFSAYEWQLFIAAQILVALAVVGQALAYLQHRKRWLLGLGILSGAEVFGGLYLANSEALVYAGLAGLAVTSATDFWARRRLRKTEPKPVMESVITCPKCGHGKREKMPTDACRFFYDCAGCGALLRPRAGDCCVFCSYGSIRCPPVQTAALQLP